MGTEKSCQRWIKDRARDSIMALEVRSLGSGGFERAAAWPFLLGSGLLELKRLH